MTNEEEYILYYKALNKWGIEFQMDMLIEEMAELTKEIIKSRRMGLIRNQEQIVEELVDVEIMLNQLKLILSDYLHSYPALYKNFREKKIERLKKMLEV